MLPNLLDPARRRLRRFPSLPSNGRDGWEDNAPDLLLLCVLVCLLLANAGGAQTNTPTGGAQTNTPVSPPRSGLELPEFKVGGVKVGVAPLEVTDSSAGLPFEVRNTSEPAAAEEPDQRGEIVAAPVPFRSPTLGFGIAGGVGYLYRPSGMGTNVPSWVTGGGAFYAENGSWGAAAGHKMNLADDSWRLLGFAGYANLRYIPSGGCCARYGGRAPVAPGAVITSGVLDPGIGCRRAYRARQQESQQKDGPTNPGSVERG